jgi:hypothetical protein
MFALACNILMIKSVMTVGCRPCPRRCPMPPLPLTLVALAAAFALISLGGGCYEFLVVDPFWPPAARDHPADSRGHLPQALLDPGPHRL